MRADAQRNAEKLRAAAAQLFQERGLHAPLKEIARRAGVSHGTLYNLFGSREALIDEVVADLAADRLREAAEQARALADPWEGFASFLERVCELQATDPALADVVSGRFPAAESLMDICGRALEAAAVLIERAQHAGALRPDFTPEDLLLLFASNARLSRAAKETAPDAWRRDVAFRLDGLRTTAAAAPSPTAPLTREQTYAVLDRLDGRG